jgi:hypothetical protein
VALAIASAARAARASPDGWWTSPIDRVTIRALAFDEDDRPYSTPARPRDVDGIVALSCEHQEGRRCGDGEGIVGELDSAAGYGRWLAAAIRLRATTGTRGYGDDLALDRAHLNAELGPAALEIGRDVVAIGPGARTELAWGDNAPPLDQIRIATARPYPLTETLLGSAIYVVGQRRDPAQAHPPLVTLARVALGIGDRVAVGLHQELMLGGDGVPSYGAWDFLAEHVRRRDLSAGATDSSNRRFGGDVSFRLRGARLYYQLTFEDMRKHFLDAVHYDADHLLGVDTPHLVVELQRTGIRSYEHTPPITQFTNAGRIVGSPLGPDTESIFAGGRLRVGEYELSPWLELARFSSDTYSIIDHGPILHATNGTPEYRFRSGARAAAFLTRELRAEAQVTYEHVTNLAFEPGVSRNNVGLVLTIIWQPGGFLTK